MTIALVEDVGGARLDGDRAPNHGIVDVGVGDVQDARIIGFGIVDDVHLHAADTPVRLDPAAQLAQRDGRRVDEAQHCPAFLTRSGVELACHQAEHVREDRHGPALVGVRQGRALQLAVGQMIVVLTVGVPGLDQAAQAFDADKLGKDQCHQVVPALEALS